MQKYSLLIAPEGIEICSRRGCNFFDDWLLIAPEGIEMQL